MKQADREAEKARAKMAAHLTAEYGLEAGELEADLQEPSEGEADPTKMSVAQLAEEARKRSQQEAVHCAPADRACRRSTECAWATVCGRMPSASQTLLRLGLRTRFEPELTCGPTLA